MIYCKHCKSDKDYHTCTNGPHIQALCIDCGNHLKFISKKLNGDTDIVKTNTMGAINNSTAIYLTISDGRICRRVQSPTNSSVQRTTKDGRVVNEEHYNGWMGKITNITTRESEYGKEWQVEINDGTMNVILSFKYSSGYAASFLKALPNVNLNLPVTFTPKATEVDGKKRTTMFLSQNGAAIKWAYTKDNPNDCPGLKQIKVKGQSTWDDSDMMEFLEAMVTNDILPNLNSDVPF